MWKLLSALRRIREETITMKDTESRVKTSGRSPASAYIKVIPQNVEADDLQLVKTLLTTGKNMAPANSSIEITKIQTSTECINQPTGIQCSCHAGFHFDVTKCKFFSSCYVPPELDSYCICSNMDSTSTAYCDEKPPIPGEVVIFPSRFNPGSDIRLEFSSTKNVTNVRWFMVSLELEQVKEIFNGTRTTIITSSRKSVLSISGIPRHWEGLYLCRFSYRGLEWEASHPVRFPFHSTDISRNPEQSLLWANTTNFPGVTIECCIWNEGFSYHVFWEPGHVPSDAVERGGQECYPLLIRSIPEQDTYYRCMFQDSNDDVVESGVLVSVIRSHDAFCSDSAGIWSTTKAGNVAKIPCSGGGRGGEITRSCLSNGQWGETKAKCINDRLLSLMQQTQRLRDGLGIPEEEISWLIESFRNITLSGQQFLNSSWDIITVVEMMKSISVMALENNIKLSFATMTELLAVYSLLFDPSLETSWMDARLVDPAVGAIFLECIENLFLTKYFDSDGSIFNFLQPHFQVYIEFLDSLSHAGYNKTFLTTPSILLNIKNLQFYDQVIENKFMVASVMIRNLSKYLPTNFGGDLAGFDQVVSNYIVVNKIMSDRNLGQIDLEVVFERSMDPNETEVGLAQCVYWDYTLFSGVGGWSTEGCLTTYEENATVCWCSHLAAISVLRSSGVRVKEETYEEEVLEHAIQGCVSLSMACLLICITVCAWRWNTDVEDDDSFYRRIALINICLSLLLADIFFLASTFMTESHGNNTCVALAFFQHLFYLATFFWKLVHGLIIFQELVFSSHRMDKQIVIPVMVVIGYICPLIIASVTIGIEYPKGEYLREGDCFLNGDIRVVFAFSGPVLLITVLNLGIIGAVVWKIQRPSESESTEEDRQDWVAIAITILTSLFGVTWILETTSMIEENHECFHYALTLINSLQGVFIMICGCLMDKKVMEAISETWQRFLALFRSMSCHEKHSYNMEPQQSDMYMEAYKRIWSRNSSESISVLEIRRPTDFYWQNIKGQEGVEI